MRLQNFLIEGAGGRAKPISQKEFDQLISKRYRDSFLAFKERRAKYFRGTESQSQPFLKIDPKKFIRVSKENQNYYTLILSHSEAWSKYPPRDKSVIMSTNIGTASHYGKPYVVLPENGARIGIVPYADIWSAFRNTLGTSGNLMPLLDVLEDAFLQANFEDAGEDIKTFKAACKKAAIPLRDLEALSNVPFSRKEGLYKWLEKVFDPEKNKFKLVKAGQDINAPDQEAWTDGECLMVLRTTLEMGYLVD